MSIDTAKRVVRRLIREMKQGDWKVFQVWDGEEMEPVPNETVALEVAFSVEMATIYFCHEVPYPHVIRYAAVSVIPCNGAEVICDWTETYTDFIEVMDRVTEYADKSYL
jgi:hypothetical protein